MSYHLIQQSLYETYDTQMHKAETDIMLHKKN